MNVYIDISFSLRFAPLIALFRYLCYLHLLWSALIDNAYKQLVSKFQPSPIVIIFPMSKYVNKLISKSCFKSFIFRINVFNDLRLTVLRCMLHIIINTIIASKKLAIQIIMILIARVSYFILTLQMSNHFSS